MPETPQPGSSFAGLPEGATRWGLGIVLSLDSVVQHCLALYMFVLVSLGFVNSSS